MYDLSQHSIPSVESLPSFMATLETNRQSMQEAEWREFTKRSVPLRKWRYFLAMDPYARWGLVKPRGYPGDATRMDFAYRHPSVPEDITSSGLLGKQFSNLLRVQNNHNLLGKELHSLRLRSKEKLTAHRK
jgi:hypothetical protein